MAHKDFSVVIPTFTGAATIGKCFDSILKQKIKKKNIEIIVVIDGSNKVIDNICNKYKDIFLKNGFDFIVEQFPKNKGRFDARLKGAQLAKTKQLLFLDDRITFDNMYFKTILNSNQKTLIPNVNEIAAKNYISRCLFLLRRFIYGKNKFGTSFKSYFMTHENFEKSPKGTTSLWVEKKIFISACENLKKQKTNSKYTNEDTKLFKEFLNAGKNIYKSGEAVIYYQPRSRAWEEVKHIYHRGPRFVDYYKRPGTRFFPLLLMSVAISILAVSLIFISPELLIQGLISAVILLIVVSIMIQESFSDIPRLIFGLPIITASFLLGLYKGIIVWLMDRVKT